MKRNDVDMHSIFGFVATAVDVYISDLPWGIIHGYEYSYEYTDTLLVYDLGVRLCFHKWVVDSLSRCR